MKFSNKQLEEPIPSEILPRFRLPKYRKLRRNVIIISSLIALVPLLILAIINYLQDQEAYRAESQYTISRILSNTKRSIEFVIEERRSALSLILNEQSYEELADDAFLKNTLNNLKNSFGGFVDLGLIDSSGIQNFYTGPYDLKGRGYKDQNWFHEVMVRGEYVSSVFMGFRQCPHFIISIKKEKENEDFYVLRATIDMELLNSQIYSLNLDNNTDAFIINKEGFLQTTSHFYGNILEKVEFEVPVQFRNREFINEAGDLGYVYIQNSPFILVSVKQLETQFNHWLSRRSDLIWFLFISISLILIVNFYGVSSLVKQLRDADLRRAKTFHNVEYTNKMATIGRMASGVAHEINNPLAIINEKAGLLKDICGFNPDFPEKAKLSKIIDSIINSVDRCSQVTHRLLGFARRMDTTQEIIDLRKLLEEVVGFQQTEVSHRGIEITYDFPDNLPSIDSDRGQLQQIFLNLINNAIAAVDDGGNVYLSAEPSGDNVHIYIKDNGSGISKEDLKHIFEPFYSTKGKRGTGLGLSITHDIVQNLGGKVEVRSQQKKGTTFEITLPLKRIINGG